ncbi:hypothetical protein E2C01_066326 [Portunus trituberculatus]|uniref:Uncharacterized protein n=1 Tax=Portunus trituberculatus TaxID=210409 RepID=A0A5B7HPG1_PORTR|nr:hypothetical protein [Portunus trituberculatus]
MVAVSSQVVGIISTTLFNVVTSVHTTTVTFTSLSDPCIKINTSPVTTTTISVAKLPKPSFACSLENLISIPSVPPYTRPTDPEE